MIRLKQQDLVKNRPGPSVGKPPGLLNMIRHVKQQLSAFGFGVAPDIIGFGVAASRGSIPGPQTT